MPIRNEFEKELNKLHKDLIKMGAIIEQSINDTIKALKTKDIELANEVIKKDDIIDEMERRIERECILLIARQQPIASDLRDITSVLKIITDLERIADHCEDISEYTIKLSQEKYIKPLIHIPEMAEKVNKMVKDTIDSYIRKDLELAYEICKRDDEVDKYFDTIIDELIEYMKNDTSVIKQCTDFMFIVKYLERMGDHATNIAEWIIYTITGEHYKE
jgi:phosphate transport system protein